MQDKPASGLTLQASQLCSHAEWREPLNLCCGTRHESSLEGSIHAAAVPALDPDLAPQSKLVHRQASTVSLQLMFIITGVATHSLGP